MIIQIGSNAYAMDAAGLEDFLDVLDAEIAEARAKAEIDAYAEEAARTLPAVLRAAAEGERERRKVQALAEANRNNHIH